MSKLPAGLSPAYWSTWYQSGPSVSESLDHGETWIGGWSNVGLYERDNKVPEYQSTTVHLTTYRLIIVPDNNAPSSSTAQTPSLQMNLRYVRQTEFYNGFMRSSPKITLSLGPSPTTPLPDEQNEAETSWTCGVCGFVNGIRGLNGTAGAKCGLCGVGYATARSISTPVTRTASPAPLSRRSQDESRSTSITSSTQALLEPAAAISSTESPATTPSVTEIACPACTFLNHPSLTSCEICSTTLPKRQPTRPERQQSAPAPDPLAATSIPSPGKMDVARLSFRKGGSSEAYRRLKNVLGDKAWERAAATRERVASPAANGTDTPRTNAGIDGILQTMSLDAKHQDDHMKDAFKDLEVLMVKLAQSLNTKLTASGSVSNEEATLIRSSLVQLGLPSPAVTQDMVRDEQKYTEGLAQELGRLLTGDSRASGSRTGLMVGENGRGVIALDEVWGLWMRARGVALLPPSTLMAILPNLAAHTSPPINLLALPSSLHVLHTPSYAPPAILSRLLTRLTPIDQDQAENVEEAEKSLSLLEISAQIGLPIGLTKELMESIEQISAPDGLREPVGMVRDDQAVGDGGARWYRDIISGWEL